MTYENNWESLNSRPRIAPGMKAAILGCDANVDVVDCGGHTKLVVLPINLENMKSSELYTFRIEKE